jgi:hypothetical protein
MPTKIVNWVADSLGFVGTQRVYVRQRWAVPDTANPGEWLDVPWVLQENLWCEQCEWSLLPSIPTAQLVLHYGRVLPHATNAMGTQAKLNLSGWWVKIEFDCADGVITWYGFIDEINDAQGGIHTTQPTGKQTFIAYSVAQCLAHALVDKSVWADTDWSLMVGGNQPLKTKESQPVAFNDNGLPNRSEQPISGSHVFYPRDSYTKKPSTSGGVNYFQYTPQYWSTKDIADYIENGNASTSISQSDRPLKFRFTNKSLLPDWDRPVVQVEGRTLLAVISDLISTDKMMQISVKVDDTVVPNEIVLEISSTIDTDIALPNGETHPASTELLKLVCREAQDVNVSVQSSTTSIANQIIVKGALKETVLTCQIEDPLGLDKPLIAGWNLDQQTKYNQGASLDTGYAAALDAEQKRFNQIARSKPTVSDTFKVFSLNPYFILDEQFANGTSNADGFIFNEPDPANPGQVRAYYPFWNEVKILPVLPFKKALDYSQAAPPVDDELLTEYRPPFVIFKHPDAGVYLQAEKMSSIDGDPNFSVGVGLTSDSQSLSLDVHGEQQHAIAAGNFVKLDADDLEPTWKYEDAYITIAIQEDRRVEAIYPATVPAGLDMVRQKVIYAGDGFRQVRLVKDTIVDLTTTGEPIKTKPGLANIDGYFIDDSLALESIAKIASYWYTVPRKILRLSTPRPSSQVAVGQILQDSDGELIGTIVTQISLSTPLGENLSVSPPTFSIVTARGEANPLSFVSGYRPNFVGMKKITAPAAVNRNLA